MRSLSGDVSLAISARCQHCLRSYSLSCFIFSTPYEADHISCGRRIEKDKGGNRSSKPNILVAGLGMLAASDSVFTEQRLSNWLLQNQFPMPAEFRGGVSASWGLADLEARTLLSTSRSRPHTHFPKFLPFFPTLWKQLGLGTNLDVIPGGHACLFSLCGSGHVSTLRRFFRVSSDLMGGL